MSKETIMAGEYAFQLPQSRDSISSAEFPLDNDNDYFPSILPTAACDEKASPCILTFGSGRVKRGRYGVPNRTISRRLQSAALSDKLIKDRRSEKGGQYNGKPGKCISYDRRN